MPRLLALAACLLLSGCASYGGQGIAPGIDGEAKVRASMGEPRLQFRDADGSYDWAYPRGPLGYDTFMVRFTSAGRVAAIESVLDLPHFARVTPGLDQEAVQRIVGPPGRVEAFPRTGELVWDYRFMDTWGYSSQFSVIFNAGGRVNKAFTWREMRDERD
jgi:hypothetical protein